MGAAAPQAVFLIDLASALPVSRPESRFRAEAIREYIEWVAAAVERIVCSLELQPGPRPFWAYRFFDSCSRTDARLSFGRVPLRNVTASELEMFRSAFAGHLARIPEQRYGGDLQNAAVYARAVEEMLADVAWAHDKEDSFDSLMDGDDCPQQCNADSEAVSDAQSSSPLLFLMAKAPSSFSEIRTFLREQHSTALSTALSAASSFCIDRRRPPPNMAVVQSALASQPNFRVACRVLEQKGVHMTWVHCATRRGKQNQPETLAVEQIRIWLQSIPSTQAFCDLHALLIERAIVPVSATFASLGVFREAHKRQALRDDDDWICADVVCPDRIKQDNVADVNAESGQHFGRVFRAELSSGFMNASAMTARPERQSLGAEQVVICCRCVVRNPISDSELASHRTGDEPCSFIRPCQPRSDAEDNDMSAEWAASFAGLMVDMAQANVQMLADVMIRRSHSSSTDCAAIDITVIIQPFTAISAVVHVLRSAPRPGIFDSVRTGEAQISRTLTKRIAVSAPFPDLGPGPSARHRLPQMWERAFETHLPSMWPNSLCKGRNPQNILDDPIALELRMAALRGQASDSALCLESFEFTADTELLSGVQGATQHLLVSQRSKVEPAVDQVEAEGAARGHEVFEKLKRFTTSKKRNPPLARDWTRDGLFKSRVPRSARALFPLANTLPPLETSVFSAAKRANAVECQHNDAHAHEKKVKALVSPLKQRSPQPVAATGLESLQLPVRRLSEAKTKCRISLATLGLGVDSKGPDTVRGCGKSVEVTVDGSGEKLDEASQFRDLPHSDSEHLSGVSAVPRLADATKSLLNMEPGQLLSGVDRFFLELTCLAKQLASIPTKALEKICASRVRTDFAPDIADCLRATRKALQDPPSAEGILLVRQQFMACICYSYELVVWELVGRADRIVCGLRSCRRDNKLEKRRNKVFTKHLRTVSTTLSSIQFASQTGDSLFQTTDFFDNLFDKFFCSVLCEFSDGGASSEYSCAVEFISMEYEKPFERKNLNSKCRTENEKAVVAHVHNTGSEDDVSMQARKRPRSKILAFPPASPRPPAAPFSYRLLGKPSSNPPTRRKRRRIDPKVVIAEAFATKCVLVQRAQFSQQVENMKHEKDIQRPLAKGLKKSSTKEMSAGARLLSKNKLPLHVLQREYIAQRKVSDVVSDDPPRTPQQPPVFSSASNGETSLIHKPPAATRVFAPETPAQQRPTACARVGMSREQIMRGLGVLDKTREGVQRVVDFQSFGIQETP